MKTEFQKCLDGERFVGNDPEIVAMTLKTKHLLAKLRSTPYEDNEAKQTIYREMFGSIGQHVYIDLDFRCEYGKNIFLGNFVIINMNCTFLDNNKITIGNNVLIAPDVKIYTATHPTFPQERIHNHPKPGEQYFEMTAHPVTIEDNVWICGGSIIVPGVTIGKNSVIGAGSVVTKAIPTNCLAAGNPCTLIRYFDR